VTRTPLSGSNVKGQGHQAVLLTAVLRRQAAPAVSMGTGNVLLCCGRLGGVGRFGAHWGRRGAGAYCVATRTACWV